MAYFITQILLVVVLLLSSMISSISLDQAKEQTAEKLSQNHSITFYRCLQSQAPTIVPFEEQTDVDYSIGIDRNRRKAE